MRVLLRVQSEPFATLGELFETRIVPGRPSWINVGFSLVFHVLVTVFLVTVRFPASPPRPRPAEKLPDTELRIGDKLYYVSRLAVPDRQPAPAARPGGLRAPARRVRRASTGGPGAGGPSTPVPPAEVATAPAPPAPRSFTPPEVKRDSLLDQTLIQPASPPKLQAPEVDLPTFRAWTAQIPKIPKPFVAPGQEAKPLPDAQPVLTPPTLNLTSAKPLPASTNPALVLALPPPLLDAPQMPSNAAVLTAQGDPADIISITRNPVLPATTLVVPAGNIAGIVGKDAGPGVPGGARGVAGAGSSPNSTGGSAKAGTNAAAGAAIAGSGTAAKGSGDAGSGTSRGPGAGTGAGGAGIKGTGLAGAGPGSGGGGTGGAGAGPRNVIITRPASGTFDAVVVQSSPLDILPGRKDLLSGRPIFTVYLAVGTAREWTLYFCVPEADHPRNTPSPVVTLTPVAPVAAPYPLRMVRPLVALPEYEKFLLVHGFVSAEGRVQRLKVVDPGSTTVDEAILSSVIDWQFRPATKDGQPILVEFLLAIPRAGL